MDYKTIDDFLKNTLKNDEAFIRAKTLCQEHCFFELNQLLQLTTS